MCVFVSHKIWKLDVLLLLRYTWEIQLTIFYSRGLVPQTA